MRIQHNINALNAHRQLGNNNTAVGKNLEKLSSGFRINRAGDDAAGLAISEKMRGQIRGLDMASRNANDGISLIQTAEGALNETHSILQRMRELAVQSSNGTYEEGVDRVQLNKEVTALKAEVDRIASSTHFNNQKLLNGELSATGGAGFTAETTDFVNGTFATAAKKATASVALDANMLKHGASLTIGNKTYMFAGDTTKTAASAENVALYAEGANAPAGVTVINISSDGAVKNVSTLIDKLVADGDFGDFTVRKGSATELKEDGTTEDKSTDAANIYLEAKEGGVFSFGEIRATLKDGSNITNAMTGRVTGREAVAAKKEVFATATADGSLITGVKAGESVKIASGGQEVEIKVVKDQAEFDALSAADKLTSVIEGYSLQDVVDKVNADSAFVNDKIEVSGTTLKFTSNDPTETGDDLAATISITGRAPTAKSTGVTFQIGANGTADDRVNLKIAKQDTATLGIDDISIATQDDANAAIALIDNATNLVSGTRADLGALQNRLEHTVANLGVSVENLTAAESRIRDVDMAKEMMEMTKNNILTQAAQAMLAQANTQPQSVLQLLQ